MKKMRKIFAVLLTLAMVFGMSMTSFAATKDTATITVNNADKATLTYAQVIKADQSTETGWAFVNTEVANAYKTAFKATDDQAAIKAMLPAANVDANKLGAAQAKAANHVTFNAMANPQTVDAAGVYLVKATEVGYTYNIMSAYIGFGEVTITGEGNVTYDYPSLVDAKLGAKKTPTKVEKEAVDTDNVVATGDILTYKVKTNVPFIAPTDTDKTFWAYDELTGAEYTEKETATITLGGENVTTAYPINWNADTAKFSVDLSNMINDANSNAGKEVVITYKVKVTSDNDVITNTATAGHKGTEDFGSKEIKVYQGNITLTKTGENDVKLANAGFEVRKDSKDSNALKFTKLTDGVYKYDPNGTETEVFTKADGTVKVQGLNVGTYYFKETTAPKGYSVNQNQSEATLAVEGKASAVLTATTSMTDTKLSALPSTGGIGTTIFTIAGCLIMIAAAGLFFASRKKTNK